MENKKEKIHMTKRFLLQTLENELSLDIKNKYTATDLKRAADISGSTFYNHFPHIDEVHKMLFEEAIINRISEKCNDYHDFIDLIINYIDKNRKLCINLYYLPPFFENGDYFIDLVLQALNEHVLTNPLPEDNKFLLGEFKYIIQTWFADGLKTDKRIIKQQLEIYMGLIIKVQEKSGQIFKVVQ